MGKGKGGCDARMSLELLDTESNESTLSAIKNNLNKLKNKTVSKIDESNNGSKKDPKVSAEQERLLSILDEENIEHLEYLVNTPKNHIEYVLAKYRLQEMYEVSQEPVKFEEQNLEKILEDVKKHPNEVRALFFDSNIFVDKLLYVYYDDKKDKFIFLSDIEKDSHFFKKIDLEFGLVSHTVENASGLSNMNGKKLHTKIGSDDFYYTPNDIHLKGQKENHYYHSIEVPEITDADIEYINNNLSNSFKQHYQKLDNFYLEVHKYKNPKIKDNYRLATFHRLDKEKQEKLLEAVRTGQPIIRAKGTKYEREMFIYPATARDMERFKDYMPKVEEGIYMYHRPYAKYKSMLDSNKKLQKLSQKKIKLDLLQEVSKEDFVKNPNAQQTFKNILELNLDKYQLNFVQYHLNKADLDIVKKSKPKTVVNNLPKSELGIFKIETNNPENTIKQLQEKGLTGNLIEQIPYNQIYKTHNYRGKITFIHNHYINPENKIKLNNNIVIHGLTGASNNPAKHLEQICKLGGLKSIAERRRFGLAMAGVSPVGDMGSNIDKGIPTTIGIQPTFGGQSIFFALNDDIMKRRDVFFSNMDFGGSQNRYNSYMNYAQSIGQKDIHTPPSHNARVKHLKSGLGSNNEAYFHDEIRLDEVAAVFINSSHYDSVIKVIEKYQEKGLWSKDLKVYKIGSGYNIDYSTAVNKYMDSKKPAKKYNKDN